MEKLENSLFHMVSFHCFALNIIFLCLILCKLSIFLFSFILCITLGKSFKCSFHFLPSNFISFIPPIYDHLRFQNSKYLLSLFLSFSLSVSFTIYSIVTVCWVLQNLGKIAKNDYMFIWSSIPTTTTVYFAIFFFPT